MTGNVNIFCDVDGVLADFIGAACRLHGRCIKENASWEFYKDWGMSDKEFWEPIQELGETFAVELEATPWASRLVDTLRAEGDVRFLTAPWRSSKAWGGRVHWLVERMGAGFEDIILCHGRLKALMASCGAQRNVLVDDSEDNIDRWNRAGGVGFLWPGPANGLRRAYDEMRKSDLAESLVFRLRRAIRRFRDHDVVSGPERWTLGYD